VGSLDSVPVSSSLTLLEAEGFDGLELHPALSNAAAGIPVAVDLRKERRVQFGVRIELIQLMSR
jgi:hypothetical protein